MSKQRQVVIELTITDPAKVSELLKVIRKFEGSVHGIQCVVPLTQTDAFCEAIATTEFVDSVAIQDDWSKQSNMITHQHADIYHDKLLKSNDKTALEQIAKKHGVYITVHRRVCHVWTTSNNIGLFEQAISEMLSLNVKFSLEMLSYYTEDGVYVYYTPRQANRHEYLTTADNVRLYEVTF